MLVRRLVTLVAVGAAIALVLVIRSGNEPEPPEPSRVIADGDNARDPARIPGRSEGLPGRPDFDPNAGSGTGAARPRPELKILPPETPGGFETERRDDRWAPDMEGVVRERVDEVLADVLGDAATKVRVEKVECRTRNCRMHVTGDDAKAFSTFVEALQDSRGFYGRAKLLMLQDYKPPSADNPQPTVNVILKYR